MDAYINILNMYKRGAETGIGQEACTQSVGVGKHGRWWARLRLPWRLDAELAHDADVTDVEKKTRKT